MIFPVEHLYLVPLENIPTPFGSSNIKVRTPSFAYYQQLLFGKSSPAWVALILSANSDCLQANGTPKKLLILYVIWNLYQKRRTLLLLSQPVTNHWLLQDCMISITNITIVSHIFCSALKTPKTSFTAFPHRRRMSTCIQTRVEAQNG